MDDTQAFVTLYQEEYPRVVAYARRRLGTLSDAEDVAADVFRLAWEKETLVSAGWLFVTAKNIVWAKQRTQVRASQLVTRLAAETNEASDPFAGDPELLAALDTLSDSDRELLMARYWDDLSGAQCAQLMGCSTATVFMRLSRARKALKSVLREGTLPIPQGKRESHEWKVTSPPAYPAPVEAPLVIGPPLALDYIPA
ncbi:MAG: RNA polymerase sigma factor [Propionibacteriaceae bacterium]|jgi:RNA polymerase sigma-70 factor (ECF subfamily)|nr:RNA polymerase sigma factor [Propionibacteriaceae bacterium]